MQIVKYKPAALGYGSESSSKLQPLDFSSNIINRFYNVLGDLEKRRGMKLLAAQITSIFGVSCSAQINNLHEYIDSSGNSTLFASGITENDGYRYGVVWRYSVTASAMISVYDANSIKDPDKKIYSSQMNDKLIFCNGSDRNFYLDKSTINQVGGSSQQLYSVITKGVSGSGTNTIVLTDSDISNWKTQTNVAVNDLVLTYLPNFIGGSVPVGGVITSVGTSSLDITNIGTSATGFGVNSIVNFSSGRGYKIVDLVEQNVIPTTNPAGRIYDNTAVGGSATSANAISVTSLDFSTTEIRAGDYVYNTTRAAITVVATVSTNLGLGNYPISGQAPGDSLVFLKDAMPIASYPHVHYGRLHLIDERDKTKIRVSGPNDAEDFTTFGKTLSSVTIDYGARQPKGDVLLTMHTFQRYLVVGGKAALFVTDGTNPIADVTADVIDLDPVGLFPQGVFSPQALQSIGNEMLYIGNDGLRSFLAAFDSKNTTTNNKSEQIKSEIIAALQVQANTTEQVQLIHYPRRNWVMMKIGDVIYNYNYTPMYSNGKFNNLGTFTKFTGLLGQQDTFFVNRAGDLITADSTGRIFTFDVSAVFTDNGINIATTYVSPWHTLQESETNADIIVKDGRYIRPVFETSAAIKYNISVVGDYSQLATDSVIVTSEVNGITNPKLSLRWRGKQAQFTITTDTSAGIDIINSYTVYGNVFGRK